MTIECPECHTENTSDSQFCKKCATPLPIAEGVSITKTLETTLKKLAKGTIFANRYEILEELGKGGMGEVYKVRDKKLDEEMALKVLKTEIAADKGIIERFKNELKLARKIGHRNICRMYDLNEEGEAPYITMEYVEGDNLKAHIIKNEKLSQDEAISIAKRVCEGLTEAHELGVVHRDLKPQNIMVDDKGNAKVMDFGIARSVEASGVTKTGVMIGTPDYMSPEQAEGEEADQRSDIYSLGVILYEMVTGSVPFKGDTAFSVALKHKTKLPYDPKKLNPELSDNLSRLILICMEKERERRYQTAAALLSDLRNVEDGLPLGTKIRPRRETFASALIRKKLFIPALAVIVLAIVAIMIWQTIFRERVVPTGAGKPSVAVLPFEDLSPEKDQGHFCDGFAETILIALGKVRDLRVPASTSSFKFRGGEQDMKEIGDKLSVETVFRGSVQIAGSRVRITVQLINVADESLLWSEQYSRKMDDVFAIQDEISLAIVDKLQIQLLAGEKAKIVKRYTENSEAYNLYLMGHYFWQERTEEALKKSIEHFEQAIEIDPDFALAYAELAHCYNILGFYGYNSPKDVYPKAKIELKKALELDDTLAEVHTISGFISLYYDWDWAACEKHLKRAIELNPGYAYATHLLAFYLRMMGRYDEAIQEIKRALELDPLSLTAQCELSLILIDTGKVDEAIEQLQKTIEMNPNFGLAHWFIGGAYQIKRRYEEAIAAYQKAIKLTGGAPYVVGSLGEAYAMSGQKEKAIDLLRELENRSKQEYIPKTSIANLCFVLGEIDRGFEMLERAYEERDLFLYVTLEDAALKSIHSDPRYIALRKKMGLE